MSPELCAEALFCSSLQPSEKPTATQVDDAVTAMLLLHGSDGCAALMAQECGDHPEAAADRMRWCGSLVRTFQPSHV
ncbi:MAG TPA: hypothetical protein VFM12_06365 [Gemmatimonadales bacterium]|nr:hypothetical protein [Gemmatimonadales bacterium]